MERSSSISLVTSDVLADFLAVDGLASWEERRPLVAEALSHATADIIGLQEAMPAQSAWLQSALSDLTMVPVIQAVGDQQVIEAVQRHYGIDLRDALEGGAEAEGGAGASTETLPRTLPDPLAERIDHILYRGRSVTVQGWHRLRSPDPSHRLSDHDPVGVILRLPQHPRIGLA